MRKVWCGGLVALAFGCMPWVGNVDGKRFPCQVNDDCAGDGFVCIAGICRDPRDLALPDGGVTDAVFADAVRDAGSDAGRDAGADAAGRDRMATDRAPHDAAAEDASAFDRATDAGADAAADGGIDAGCVSDNDCPTHDGGSRLCFSGRCGVLAVERLAASVTLIQSTSLAVKSNGAPAIAFYVYDSSIGNGIGYYEWTGSEWLFDHSAASASSYDGEPDLALSPDQKPWVVYRNNNDDSYYLARSTAAGGLSFLTEQVGSYGNDYEHAALAIDPDSGAQHILLRSDYEGMLHLVRTPVVPDAIPDAPYTSSRVYNDDYVSWPVLRWDPSQQQLFGAFNGDYRPRIALWVPTLGFVSAYIAPPTADGCVQLGLSATSNCSAYRPIDLAIDSSGAPHLCTHIDESGVAKLVYIYPNGAGFTGVKPTGVDSRVSSIDPGVRCAIVVDALGVAHVFARHTEGGGAGFKHVRLTLKAAGEIDSAVTTIEAGDTGFWPRAVVDRDGRLDLVWVRATTRSSNITASALLYGRLEWNE